jgi:drug/metabolite transporter (DMT)-like permease
MIFLILSILASSLIFVIFRLFPKYKIDTFQAIVINYFVAFVSGITLFGNELKPQAFENLSWLPFCILCGFLFISLFIIMGISSQKNGVALTSVSVKMSMAMTLFLMIIWYSEPFTFLRILGIVLAIFGVTFMSWSKNKAKKEQKVILWMLLILFLGSGALDFTLNYTQKFHLKDLPTSLFSAFGFGIAGLLGLFILLIQLIQKKTIFSFKNVIAGIILGIPNYFSIFLLMQSYTEMHPWSDSTVLAITNVSIVLLSAFYGFVLFKEHFSKLKAIGLFTSIAAIIILYFASL